MDEESEFQILQASRTSIVGERATTSRNVDVKSQPAFSNKRANVDSAALAQDSR